MPEFLKNIPAILGSLGSLFDGNFDGRSFFMICATVGTLFFMLRVFLIIIGVGGDAADATDAADSMDADGTIDADAGLHIFSINTISSFIMMFGWTGLACKAYGLSSLLCLVIPLAVGLATMFIIALLMKFVYSLRDPGDTFKAADALGTVAEVFEKIPAGGRGMVFVIIKGARREFSATSEDGEEIPSFTKVMIEKIVSTDSVIVKKI